MRSLRNEEIVAENWYDDKPIISPGLNSRGQVDSIDEFLRPFHKILLLRPSQREVFELLKIFLYFRATFILQA